jgi:hypothetical protein
MIRNLVITAGGVAQDLLPVNYGRTRITVEPITEDCWVNIGTTAAVDVGEKVLNGTQSVFDVANYPEVGGRVSVFSATTGAKIIVREM